MRNFASPSRYIQGENALFENAKPILELGSHPVLLCDSVVYDIVGERFEKYLLRYGFTVLPVFFNGEASDNEINRVVNLAEENGCDLVIKSHCRSSKITSRHCSDYCLYGCSCFSLVCYLYG